MRRAEAEYRSAALTHHFGLWLLQAGASPDLFEYAQRIVGDELAHSEMSHAVYLEAGGDAHPAIARESLELGRTTSAPLEHDLLLSGVEMFCLGETVAVRLFSRMREGCEVPVARRALDRILRDEVAHRDFGWTFLEWMLESPSALRYRHLLEGALPAMLERVRRSYEGTRTSALFEAPPPAEALDASDQAWGLIPRAAYREAVQETFARDYAPRFADLGVRIVAHDPSAT